jgi:hypothetical protein
MISKSFTIGEPPYRLVLSMYKSKKGCGKHRRSLADQANGVWRQSFITVLFYSLFVYHIKIVNGLKRDDGANGVFINHLLLVVRVYQYYIVVKAFYNAPDLKTTGQKNSDRHVVFPYVIKN